MAQSIRDKIRAATLGKPVQFKSKTFNYEGVDVEFRQPNLKDRQMLINKARKSNGDLDFVEFLVWSVIANTYVPDTNEKVFDDTDYDVMTNQNSGSFVDQFGGEIAALMNVEEGDAKN